MDEGIEPTGDTLQAPLNKLSPVSLFAAPLKFYLGCSGGFSLALIYPHKKKKKWLHLRGMFVCAVFAVAVDEPLSGCAHLQMTLELSERLPIPIQVQRSKIHVFPLQNKTQRAAYPKQRVSRRA